MTVIADDFDRADESPASGWALETWMVADVVSNQMQLHGVNCRASHNTALATDSQWAEVQAIGYTAGTTASWRELGAVVRYETSGLPSDGYLVFAGNATEAANTFTWLEISKLVGVSRTVLVSKLVPDMTGKTLAIDVTGSTLRAYVDGVLELTTTDGSYPASPTRRKAGVYGYQGLSGHNVILDAFRGGDGAYPGVGGAALRAKVWDGATWVEGVSKVWTGAAWVAGEPKVWTGAAWV